MRTLTLILLAAAFAGVATGAGSDRPVAQLIGKPPRPVVGSVWQAQFTLRLEGRPLAAERPRLWVRGTGSNRSFPARGLGRGSYRARVVFTTAGGFRYGVTVRGQSLPLGILTVRPESFRAPLGLAIGPDSAVYVADAQGTTVVRIDPETKARVVAARGLKNPLYVAFDRTGRLLVADESNRILRFEPNGSRVVIAGNGRRGHTGDGGPASAASLGGASGMDVDGAGNLILAEYDGWIRVIRPNGTIGSLAGNGSEGYAGDGGPASDAILRHPHDVALMPDDSIIVADSHNSAIRRIGADGLIRTVATDLGAPVGVAPAPNGAVFVAEGDGRITLVRPDGSRTTVATGASPFGIASDGDGSVYFSELQTRRVKRVDANTGTVTTLFP